MREKESKNELEYNYFGFYNKFNEGKKVKNELEYNYFGFYNDERSKMKTFRNIYFHILNI